MRQHEPTAGFDWADAPTNDADALFQFVVDALEKHERFNWVGIYWVDGQDLVLRAWQGPQATESTRININEGVCGAAVREAAIQNVPDVNKDPRYISCFLNTRSELVVPVRTPDGKVVGEIDIDSDAVGPFTKAQVEYVDAAGVELGRRFAKLGDGPR